MVDFETSSSKLEISKSNSWKITSISKTTPLQREPFLTMFYTANLSPLLLTKWGLMLIIILSNYQKCPLPVAYRRCEPWRHSKTITWFACIPSGKTFVFWQPARKCMQSYHDYTSFCPAKHDVNSVNRGRFERKHRSHRLYIQLSKMFNQQYFVCLFVCLFLSFFLFVSVTVLWAQPGSRK